MTIDMKRFQSDARRVGFLLSVASLMVALAAPLARAIGMPEISPWGLFAGLALYGVALSHMLRRALFPYLDLREISNKAGRSAQGAGLVFLGVCVVLSAFILLMGNVARAQDLPPNARQYLPVLRLEQRTWWPSMPMPSALAAQVEQETCISLKHSRCWSPRAELKTAREHGVGLGQITRTARFDALAELRRAYPQALDGWGWENASLYDPALQLRALVLKNLQGWKTIQGAASDYERLAFTFAAYNGGLGGLSSDRQLCRGTPGCNAARWFAHVERTSLKSKTTASGYGKSFFEINREYVRNVLELRRPRYVAAMGGV